MWNFKYTPVVSHRSETDRAPPNPFLIIRNNGEIEITDDQVLVSACRMRVYKFPFDIQTCNLSFKSVVHNGESVAFDNFICPRGEVTK